MKKESCIPPGELIDVGGHRLHLYSTGPIAEAPTLPTIVIEGGCGCSLIFYSWFQQKLSKQLRVCSYDRAGLGWSEDSNQPRDAEHVANQLHTLLSIAGIDGPIVLVGHSIAGLYLRLYANKYPDNIVGMVLLDASHPRQNEILAVKGFTCRKRIHNKAMALYASLGLGRVFFTTLGAKW